MGYMIQQSLQNALARAGVQRSVVTLITQTLCRADDPDLRTPSKPVGHVLDPVRQARLVARGIPVRDGRRLAPSPKPAGIVEQQMVRDLAAAGHIVIAGGGGGPPVYPDPKLGLEGIDAVAGRPAEARAIAERLGGTVVVKAQVHAGGRGKAGGVKLADGADAAKAAASAILGMTIKGLTVHKVLVAPAAEIASESYVGIVVDRASQRPVLMVSAAGGIDIEEVAAKTPEKIHRLA